MLSILEALQFAFRKTHILIWGLFLYILCFSSFNIKIFNEDFNALLGQMKSFSFAYSDIWQSRPLEFVLIGIGFVSLVFAFVLIKAKQNAYSLKTPISVRVFLNAFLILFVAFCGYYYLRGYWVEFLGNWSEILAKYQIYSWGAYLLSEILFAFLFFLLFSPFVLAYLMQLNFSNYFVCLANTYKNFSSLFYIFGSILVYSLFLILPFELIENIISHMDIQAVLAYAHNSKSGSVLALFALILMIGVPAGFLFCFTRKGRFFVLLTSAFFCWVYHVMSHSSQADFSFTLLLYFYLIWLLVSLHMIVLVIILPAGILNLLAQGAFEIHSTFNKYVNHPKLFEGKRS